MEKEVFEKRMIDILDLVKMITLEQVDKSILEKLDTDVAIKSAIDQAIYILKEVKEEYPNGCKIEKKRRKDLFVVHKCN